MAILDQITVRKTNTTYDIADSTARADITTINSKIPNGTISSNQLVNQSMLDTMLEGKADVSELNYIEESVSEIEDKIPLNASSSNQLATMSDVSAAYKPKGNATLATLPPLINSFLNCIYNMTEDFVTTADFAEGAGKSVKAGNEVGIINVSTNPELIVIKYTVLGGFIDLSAYATVEALNTKMTTATYDSNGNGIVDNAEKVNGKTVDENVPSGAKFTDTVYDDTEVRGLISGVDNKVGDITELDTEDTSNLVAAVNELVDDFAGVDEEVEKLSSFTASETILDSSGGEILDSSGNRILDTQVGAAGAVIALNNILTWFKTNLGHLVQDSGYTVNKATYELINS